MKSNSTLMHQYITSWHTLHVLALFRQLYPRVIKHRCVPSFIMRKGAWTSSSCRKSKNSIYMCQMTNTSISLKDDSKIEELWAAPHSHHSDEITCWEMMLLYGFVMLRVQFQLLVSPSAVAVYEYITSTFINDSLKRFSDHLLISSWNMTELCVHVVLAHESQHVK